MKVLRRFEQIRVGQAPPRRRRRVRGSMRRSWVAALLLAGCPTDDVPVAMLDTGSTSGTAGTGPDTDADADAGDDGASESTSSTTSSLDESTGGNSGGDCDAGIFGSAIFGSNCFG